MNESEEIKGRLLVQWIEDLKNDKKPGYYLESENLSESDTEELLELARFLKAAVFPSTNPVGETADHAANLRIMAQREYNDQVAANRILAEKMSNFSELVREAASSQRVNMQALQNSLGIPGSVYDEIQSGTLPPHRLPIDKMTRLLFALRLGFKDVVSVIRKSSTQWLIRDYSKDQTQLARIDATLSNAERRNLMEARGDGAGEVNRIENYCDRLFQILP
jgi:hypothetical protein